MGTTTRVSCKGGSYYFCCRSELVVVGGDVGRMSFRGRSGKRSGCMRGGDGRIARVRERGPRYVSNDSKSSRGT